MATPRKLKLRPLGKAKTETKTTDTKEAKAPAQEVQKKAVAVVEDAGETEPKVKGKRGRPKVADGEKDEKRTAELSERRMARIAAANAVSAFYEGKSLPFKAAADKFRPLNFNLTRTPTRRQSALMVSMLLNGDENVKKDGTFTRGAFLVPDDGGVKRQCQPESGCLGDMLGRAVKYISGPKDGREQRHQVLQFDWPTVKREIAASFGDKAAKIVDDFAGKVVKI